MTVVLLELTFYPIRSDLYLVRMIKRGKFGHAMISTLFFDKKSFPAIIYCLTNNFHFQQFCLSTHQIQLKQGHKPRNTGYLRICSLTLQFDLNNDLKYEEEYYYGTKRKCKSNFCKAQELQKITDNSTITNKFFMNSIPSSIENLPECCNSCKSRSFVILFPLKGFFILSCF